MADLLAAGQLALATALAAWERRIVDPPRSARAGDHRDTDRQFIDALIRTPAGIDWSWLHDEDRYQADGDFEWCGAFGLGYCWGAAGLDVELRRLYASSTARINAWAQYRPLFGTANEHDVMARFPRPELEGERRRFLKLDERSLPEQVTAWAPRAGDILLCGAVPGASRGALDCGTHVALVERWDPVAGVLHTVEGNATGLGPDGSRYQGVVKQTRPVGLHNHDSAAVYHARRLIRPGVNDLTGTPA